MPEYIQEAPNNAEIWLKRWIWLYFWLLIFEGALRKWVVPGLSEPLLIVRDPVVLIIYFQAFRAGKFAQARLWPIGFLSLAFILFAMTQILFGVGDPVIALYGLRCYLLHLPLIVIIPETLTAADMRAFGKWLLILAIPMTFLMAVQYYALSDAWINKGAGSESAQIGSAMGHVRASGTFSFSTGVASFLPLVGAFVVAELTRRHSLPRWLVWGAAIAVVAAIPVSGSRTVLVEMGAIVCCLPFIGLLSVSQFLRAGKLVIALVIVLGIASQLQFVQDATQTFKHRLHDASENEGDAGELLNSRVMGGVEEGFASVDQVGWLGQGIGMGSNVAAYLVTGFRGGKAVFLLSESEWPRVVEELGPGFGLLFMGIRVLFAAYLFAVAFKALKADNPLPFLLLPGVILGVVFGQMEQTSILGFMVFSSGLLLAAAREQPSSEEARVPASVPLRRRFA